MVKKMGRPRIDIWFRIEEKPQLAILDSTDCECLRNGAVYARLRKLDVNDQLAW